MHLQGIESQKDSNKEAVDRFHRAFRLARFAAPAFDFGYIYKQVHASVRSHSMSAAIDGRYVIQMGYQPSDPIDYNFLMSIPYGGIDPKNPYSMWCGLNMVQCLHDIGIVTIQQLLDQELGMMLVHLEVLLCDTTFCILKDLIHIIRGGPLLDVRFLRRMALPQFRHYGHIMNRDIYMMILRALGGIDIFCISSLVELNKSSILYRLDTHESIILPDMVKQVLCAMIDKVKESAFEAGFGPGTNFLMP